MGELGELPMSLGSKGGKQMDPLGYVVVGVPLFLIVLGTIGGLICRQLDRRLSASQVRQVRQS
jgi:hypothetical protein